MTVASLVKPLSTWKFWKELIVMTLGMVVTAAAVYYFLVPGNLVIGSIPGLAMVLSGILASAGLTVKVSLLVTAINVVLLLLAFILLGSEFGIKTVYTALLLGPLMDLWEMILPYQDLIEPGQAVSSVMGDPWLDLVCFVVTISASQAILFSINASTGGLDIVAKIMNKFTGLDIGTSVTISGVVVSLTAFFLNPFRIVILGLIGTWMNGLVVDYFTVSITRKKRVCIITDEHERVREFIVDKLHRGCTLYETIGGYSGARSIEIQALLARDEFVGLMKFIKDNNIKAFITAGHVSEVYGLWAKHHRLH